MAEPTDSDDLPQAMVATPKRHRLSIVWIIPILAALVAIGIAVQRMPQRGPDDHDRLQRGARASRPARRSSSTRT